MAVARTLQNLNSRVQQDSPLLRRGKVAKPGEGISVWWMGDERITLPAVSEDTGSEYAFWLDHAPSGAGPLKHVHTREEEGFFVIRGELELQAGRLQDMVGDGAT
jgi:quercetin dioxygenase-like cupin family protein